VTTHRLPSGKTTKSDAGYVRAWRKIARELEKRMPDYKVVAFDPGFTLRRLDDEWLMIQGRDVDIPMAMARDLIDNTLPVTIYANKPPWNE
jgi:hypothetical protein